MFRNLKEKLIDFTDDHPVWITTIVISIVVVPVLIAGLIWGFDGDEVSCPEGQKSTTSVTYVSTPMMIGKTMTIQQVPQYTVECH